MNAIAGAHGLYVPGRNFLGEGVRDRFESLTRLAAGVDGDRRHHQGHHEGFLTHCLASFSVPEFIIQLTIRQPTIMDSIPERKPKIAKYESSY